MNSTSTLLHLAQNGDKEAEATLSLVMSQLFLPFN